MLHKDQMLRRWMARDPFLSDACIELTSQECLEDTELSLSVVIHHLERQNRIIIPNEIMEKLREAAQTEKRPVVGKGFLDALDTWDFNGLMGYLNSLTLMLEKGGDGRSLKRAFKELLPIGQKSKKDVRNMFLQAILGCEVFALWLLFQPTPPAVSK